MKWIRGYVLCQISGGSFERFLNVCRHHGVMIWKVQKEEELSFVMCADDFKKIVPLAYKTSVKIHILEKTGFPFQVRAMFRNWSFYSGFLLFLVLMELMSSFVWQITFSGQRAFSKETLLRDVEQMQVYVGMRRKNLDCDSIEKNLRELHPEISWVSAEEIGSVLKISVKEGKNISEATEETRPCNLIAMYDGTVEEISVSRGTAAVKKGDSVKKGDVLISGLVPVTDDGGQVVEEIPVEARGEVVLSVHQKVSEEISLLYKKKNKTGKICRTWQIKFGNSIFSVKNPMKQLDNSCKYDIITNVCCEKTFYPLMWNFKLQTEDYVEYKESQAVYTKDELKREGSRHYQKLLDALRQKGMNITDSSAVLSPKDDKTWLLTGEISFLCSTTVAKELSVNS